jgi:hypothetical protein
VGVTRTIATNPHVAFVVDEDPVVRLRPLVALTGSAPGLNEVSFRVELENRRCAFTALTGRRVELCASLVVVQGRGTAMNDPDVVALVHPDPDGGAEEPMIRQRLRPEWVNLEARRPHHTAAILRGDRSLQHDVGYQEPTQDRREDRTNQPIPSRHIVLLVRARA